ncbi:SRPBCC domain-containing protein [uncultured Tenacibaculum sp.]|uniref:SRPBCC family protein n=1 Tax=uncultured Tenacibaculum sp. TaxID=174713 RepID=UPI00262D7249|nr:SRPBCC domain-containing protein [uncultured Tenacibaculum sp.]
MKKTDKPVIVEENFTVSINELWGAITEVNRMKQWFFENIESFEPTVGFKTKFIVQNEDRIFPHLWEVTEVIPKERICYNWKYEGYKGDSFVTFEIFKSEQGSKLILTHKVTESFTADIEEFKRESCIGGWNWFIKNQLKNYLDT